MNLSRDIHSLTDFKRHTPEYLRQLKETGDRILEPSAVVAIHRTTVAGHTTCKVLIDN